MYYETIETEQIINLILNLLVHKMMYLVSQSLSCIKINIAHYSQNFNQTLSKI